MAKNPQLEGYENESLRSVEHLPDRSELTGLYPGARKDWEGTDLMSSEERSKKRDLAELQITLSIRKWFVAIGLLTPMPVILMVIIVIAASTYVTSQNAGFFLLPLIIALGLWVLFSYLAIKRLLIIFYDHATRATPFLIVLICLLGLSVQTIYIVTQPIHTDFIIWNTLVVCLTSTLVSVALTGSLLPLWTSQVIKSNTKLIIIGLIALLLALVATFATIT